MFALVLFFSAGSAFAGAPWNGTGGDCTPTVAIGNYSTGTGVGNGNWGCWTLNSVQGGAGDVINVSVYYHNSSQSNATNTKVSISQNTSGSASVHSFTGTITSDQGSESGTVTLNLSSAQKVTFGDAQWQPISGQKTSFSSKTVNIGTVQPGWNDYGSVIFSFYVDKVAVQQNTLSVTTDAINQNSVTSNSAYVTGSYSYPNSSSVSTWFEYGTNSSLKTGSLVTSASFGTTLSNLLPNTQYFYKACAQTSTTSKCGSTEYFTTQSNTTNNCTITSFYASSNNITAGNPVTLTWTSTGNCGPFYINGIQSTSPYVVYPYTSTNYVLTTSNGQSSSQYVTVGTVQQYACVITAFSANPSYAVSAGAPVTLSWSSTNCNTLSLSGIGNVAQSGSQIVYPYSSTNYVLSATGNNGSDSSSQYVTVNGNNNSNPTVTTNYPTYVGQNSATLSGYANSNGGNMNAWIEFPCYGTQYGNTYGTTSTSISSRVYSLSPNTTYTYCAAAQNTSSGQIVRGSQMSFTTDGGTNNYVNAPLVNTYAATYVNQESAQLNGYVDANGAYTTRWFRYGTTRGSLYLSTNTTSQGTSARSISDTVSSLSPNTTYYFQAVGQNSYGTTYGDILSFSTATSILNNGGSTSALTTIATSVGTESAQLNGLLLNTTTYNTSVYFEYGTTVAMGSRTTSKNLGLGTSLSFSDYVSNLAPNTIYFYRANAENPNGTAKGTIEIFRTGKAGGATTTTRIVNTVTRVGAESPIMLKIENKYEMIAVGDVVEYTVTYKNIGSAKLTHPLLQVVVPKYLSYTNASRGTYEASTATLSVPLEDLLPQAGGVVYVQAKVISLPENHSQVVTTAVLTYTTPNNAQENAMAYVLNHDNGMNLSNTNGNSLAGAAFLAGWFGNGLVWWLLILIIILLLILIIRNYYRDQEYRRANPRTNHINHTDLPH